MYASAFLVPELLDMWGPSGLGSDQEQEAINVPLKYLIGARTSKRLEMVAEYCPSTGQLLVKKTHAMYQALKGMNIRSHPRVRSRAGETNHKFTGKCRYHDCRSKGHYSTGCPERCMHTASSPGTEQDMDEALEADAHEDRQAVMDAAAADMAQMSTAETQALVQVILTSVASGGIETEQCEEEFDGTEAFDGDVEFEDDCDTVHHGIETEC